MSRARCGHIGRGNHTYLLEQEGTAVAQRTCAPTSSTSGPAAPIPHDLPALPGSDLAALRARIDAWDHIPTARTAAGSYTRAQLDAAIAKAADDEPRIPGPRKPSAYDAIVIGQPHAWSAF